jgi:hypothetical protein
LALIMLKVFARDLPPAPRFLLRTVVVSAAIGIAAACFTWLPADAQPVLLATLMPARILNYDVMVLAPLLIGLLGRWHERLASQLLLALFLAALLFNARSPFAVRALEPMLVMEMALVATALISLVPPFRPQKLVYAGCVGIMLVAASATLRQFRPSSYYRDRTNDPLFAPMAAETEGVALSAGSYQLVQLYTRRPMLIDGGGIDTVTYAPDTGRRCGAFFATSRGRFLSSAELGPRIVHASARGRQACMGAFSPEKWQGHRRVRVSQILTSVRTTSKLPIVAEEGCFVAQDTGSGSLKLQAETGK